MIQVIDRRKSERATSLVTLLRARGIPASFVKISEYDFSCLPMGVVVFTDALDESAKITEKLDPETVLLTIGEHVKDPLQREAEKTRVMERVIDLLFVKYGINIDTLYRMHFRDQMGKIKFCMLDIEFTPTERLILRLLALAPYEYITAKTIAEYCLESSKSARTVAVHIASINNRGVGYALFPVVRCKRSKGYKLG